MSGYFRRVEKDGGKNPVLPTIAKTERKPKSKTALLRGEQGGKNPYLSLPPLLMSHLRRSLAP